MRRKTVVLSCGIPLLLISALFTWLHFWSAGWEKRWLTFRQQAEAQGEDFTWQTTYGTKGEKDNNFFAHPWVKEKATIDSDDPLFDNDVNDMLMHSSMDSVEIDEASGKSKKQLWLEKADELIAKHDKDLSALCDAASRPECSREISTWAVMAEDSSWSILSDWSHLLLLRAYCRQATHERVGFEHDMSKLRAIAQHALGEHTTLAVVVGVGMFASLNEIAKRDLAKGLAPEQKAFWLVCLRDPGKSLDRVLMDAMRVDRNGMLQLLENDFYNSNDFIARDAGGSLWQKNFFVQKALLAGNKLMLCEDFQESIAAPHLRGEAIGRSHFEEFKKRIEAHRKEDSFHGRIGLAPWIVLGSLHGGLDEIEKKRRRLLKKLAQSP